MPNLKPIRRSQLIAPFGVGALVDFRNDESLMTAGLDEWPDANDECPSDWLVTEERLQTRLGVSHFRLPADYREQGSQSALENRHIPFVRFPLWHYCPIRGTMAKLRLFSGRVRCPCMKGLGCGSRRPLLIPSRFIAVCPKGHIEDFPFMEWVHKDGYWDDTHKLRLLPGRSSASLSGVEIQCSCGKSETMVRTFNFDANSGGSLHSIGFDCSGGKPWLGAEGGRNQCGEFLRVVQRGASNVYFPCTVSSIYLPLWGTDSTRKINQLIQEPKIWKVLTAGLDDGKYIQATRCDIVAEMLGVKSEELKRVAQKRLDGAPLVHEHSEEAFRRQEYDALRTGSGGVTTELMVSVIPGDNFATDVAHFVQNVGLVKKLRETRALVGFSRLLPIEDPTSSKLLPIAERREMNWLPASVVYGEGIFVEFNADTIREWALRPVVIDRIAGLLNTYNRRRVERGIKETRVSAKYVLLHTFAHALIRELSFACGYGSAALRERIYCELDNVECPMQGVLIYTASGDSEGSLGGLVRQGEPSRFNIVVENAIRRMAWCSSDPVCIESNGQGIDNANLAACHGCVLLPETSCEHGNRLLDRGLLVGTLQDFNLRFFKQFDTIE